MASIGAPPEAGQMVNVRSRNWIVTDISGSALPVNVLQAPLQAPHHLVSLSSIEDDALGEEINVIWELEPGAKVVEKVALPDPTGFDPPDRLDAFLDAVRWGASSSADEAHNFTDVWLSLLAQPTRSVRRASGFVLTAIPENGACETCRLGFERRSRTGAPASSSRPVKAGLSRARSRKARPTWHGRSPRLRPNS
jgi:hypothetical protein